MFILFKSLPPKHNSKKSPKHAEIISHILFVEFVGNKSIYLKFNIYPLSAIHIIQNSYKVAYIQVVT